MALTDKEVNHVARLARLALSDAERKTMAGQLDRILESMLALQKYNVQNVLPTAHSIALQNVWRQDASVPFADTEAILNNAPDREDIYFKVKKIIES